MKKFGVIAGLLALFAGVSMAVELDVNGSFATENNQIKNWKILQGRNVGTLQPAAPNGILVSAENAVLTTAVGPMVRVKDQSEVTISADLQAGEQLYLGVFLYRGNGGYISSTLRWLKAPRTGRYIVKIPLKDPTGKGIIVGQAAPLIRVAAGRKATVRNLKFEVDAAASTVVKPADSGSLIVRTVPDGYYDSKIGWVYNDSASMLQFPMWAKTKKFTDPEVTLTLTLPKNCSIIWAGNFRRRIAPGNIIAKDNVWTVKAGRTTFANVWTLPASSSWKQFVPLTFSNFVLMIAPENNTRLPAEFTVPWSISGQSFKPVTGTMKLKTLPQPRLQGKLDKKVWSPLGSVTNNWDTATYTRMLKMFQEFGLNGIIDTKSGFVLPEESFPAAKLKSTYGLTPVMRQQFNFTMRPDPDKMREAGFPVRESDLKVNASGKRELTNRGKKTRQIYCFTAMAEPDSPVRRYMVMLYKQEVKRGFEYFFPDYEPWPFNSCWCEKCRTSFARQNNLDVKAVLQMKPGEIVKRYPVRFWEFVNRKIARVFGLLNQEVGAPIGWNSCVVLGNTYFAPSGGYGFSAYAEDPRYYDNDVAFFSVDALSTANRAVYETAAFLQKRPNGEFELKKPIITRASSMLFNNWLYICVLGNFERLEERGYTGMGMDYRREMQKLELVSDFALGVDGVEIDVQPEAADASAVTGVVEGLQFAVNYAPFLNKNLRVDNALKIFDATGQVTPFAKLGPQGALGRFIWQFVKSYGPVQGFVSARGNTRLVTVVNWDFYQDKKVRLELSGCPAGGRINVDINGQNRYTVQAPFDGKNISLDLPKGAYAAITIVPEAKYPVRAVVPYTGGTAVPLGPVREDNCGLKYFIGSMNNFLRLDKRRYPDAGFELFDVKEWSKRNDDR